MSSRRSSRWSPSTEYDDDKYGFEAAGTAPSAKEFAEGIHCILGVQFEKNKLQLSCSPVILGATYNLEEMVLEIKKSCKEELTDTIASILKSGTLDPGSRASSFVRVEPYLLQAPFGKTVGHGCRSHVPHSAVGALAPAVEQADHVRAAERSPSGARRSALFTDGFAPDPRKSEKGEDRVGAVMFDRRADRPFQFSEIIDKDVSKRWLPRKTDRPH